MAYAADSTVRAATQRAADRKARRSLLEDKVFEWLTLGSATLVVVLLLAVMVSLFVGAWPALAKFGPAFIWIQTWNPVTEVFGALPAIYGTIVTSVIAMVFGIPVSFGIAIFLTEICPAPLRRPIGIAIELLAGIPSIIYGLWGFFVLAPFLQTTVQPLLINTVGNVPIIGVLFSGAPYGIGLLTAGIVLAVMVLPFITSVTRDVFQTVPVLLRESAYGMGMTTWEVVRHIVIPYTRVRAGGIMLGLGRALRETMAVTFVIGNSHHINASLLSPSTTISASIANEFNEATGGMYTSALIALGLVLFIITFAVLAIAKWLLVRSSQA